MDRIYDQRHDHSSDHVMHVTESGAGTLSVLTIDDDNAASIQLDLEGVRKLRLALQRFERKQA